MTVNAQGAISVCFDSNVQHDVAKNLTKLAIMNGEYWQVKWNNDKYTINNIPVSTSADRIIDMIKRESLLA